MQKHKIEDRLVLLVLLAILSVQIYNFYLLRTHLVSEEWALPTVVWSAVALSAIVCIYTMRKMIRLRNLAEAARMVGSGDYELDQHLGHNTEVDALLKAFKSMRESIEEREAEIIRQANWDPLTNLPNRLYFAKRVADALEHAKAMDGEVYLLKINLDRFKSINSVLGQKMGDEVLIYVATQLLAVADGDTSQVARLGGDEFAIMLEMGTIEEARKTAGKLLKLFEEPIIMGHQAVDISAGIGIAGYPLHAQDAETLINRAEIAMWRAKKCGNDFVIYDPRFDTGSQENLSLMSDLRRAVEHNEMRLFLQPKIRIETGEVIGIEALIRWEHPDRGMIYPDKFIPFAEKSGFIRVLTLWVLDKAAMISKDLAASGCHQKISVNLSTRDLLDINLPQKFAEILKKHNVSASTFCLEITESSIMDDPVRAQNTLEALHAMGAELSIDDFGSGYSSLAYLKRLPVDELKIDKSFVMNMETDVDDEKIVRSTIELGHNMGLRVVAEGVESHVAWQLLDKMGCDHGQGYFVSRPIPSERLADWIKQWTPPIKS